MGHSMKRVLMIFIPAVFPGYSIAQPPQAEMKSWNPRVLTELRQKTLKLFNVQRKLKQRQGFHQEEIRGNLSRVDTLPGGSTCEAFYRREGDVETCEIIVTSNTCTPTCPKMRRLDVHKISDEPTAEFSSPKGAGCTHRSAIRFSDSKEVFLAIRQACEDHERKQLSLAEKKG